MAKRSVKVLIIHQHFRTPANGGAIRSYYLAKALVERGVQVVVITAHNEPGYSKASVEGIDVHYLPIAYDNRFTFIRRLRAFLSFALAAVKAAASYRDADICYAISTPLTTGLSAMVIRRKYGIPYIFEVGDLWPDAPIALGFIRNPLTRALLHRMEKVIYKRALSIVALSVPIRDVISKRIRGKHIHVLPNMADTDFFHPEERDCSLEERFGVKGKFVISYIGATGLANGLSYIVKCAATVKGEGLPLHFLVCGEGALRGNLQNEARNLLLPNVTFLPFTNRDGVREVMNVTDAAFICYQPVPILETGSPNKYFDGLAAGKLIIANFGGWIREEIEREKCGIYVDPSSAEHFLEKIRPFVDDASRLKEYQLAGRRLGEQRYSRSVLGRRYWELIATAVQHDAV
jgi:glycosyltransferase involved in cell wall biosynthesis